MPPTRRWTPAVNAGKFGVVKIPHRRRLKRCLGITSDEAVEDLCRLPPVVAEDPTCNVGVKRGEEAVGHERRDELQRRSLRDRHRGERDIWVAGVRVRREQGKRQMLKRSRARS